MRREARKGSEDGDRWDQLEKREMDVPAIISYRIVHQGTKGFSRFFLTENLFDGG
jgi:hypothetical protein